MLIIIPFAFLELRPEATKAALKKAQDWLLGHARQLMAYTALIPGAYLALRADKPNLTCHSTDPPASDHRQVPSATGDGHPPAR